MQQNSCVCSFTGSDSWVILSPIEQSIKRKIESVGTPLSEWNINIYRGVLTGYNDAFIISTEKRDQILAACKTEDERSRTAELIRPILRGRDIKRYGYDWADLWLIATFPSRHYDINDYPSVKNFLLSFSIERLEQTGTTHIINGQKVQSRKKTNNKWFEVQDSISYWDLFFQPKICWKAVGRNLTFAIVDPGTFLTAPASFISAGNYNEYLLAFLCSNIGKYYIYQNSDTTGAGDIMLNIQSLVKFPIPLVENKVVQVTQKVKELSSKYSESIQQELDELIYSMYGFDEREIVEIESY